MFWYFSTRCASPWNTTINQSGFQNFFVSPQSLSSPSLTQPLNLLPIPHFYPPKAFTSLNVDTPHSQQNCRYCGIYLPFSRYYGIYLSFPDTAEYIFLVFFICETAVRMWAMGHRVYFESSFNRYCSQCGKEAEKFKFLKNAHFHFHLVCLIFNFHFQIRLYGDQW